MADEIGELQKKAVHLRDSLRRHMAECHDGPYSENGDTAAFTLELPGPLSAVEQLLTVQIEAAQKAQGVCEKCHGDIEHERLLILPLTTLCVHCATLGPTCEMCGNPIEADVLENCPRSTKCRSCSKASAEVMRKLYARMIWQSRRQQVRARAKRPAK